MMTPYKFARLPSNSAVSALVTVLVGAWFVVAGGAILAGRHSGQTVQDARAPSVTLAAAHGYVPLESAPRRP